MDIKGRFRLLFVLGFMLQLLMIGAFIMLCIGKFEVNALNMGLLIFMVFSLVSGIMIDVYRRYGNINSK